ncbi:hypothetical protein HYDPIDRAFT_189293 [Hydnomerulius pinastri MD-312]|uniref:Endoplasmic reticulum-based factor for assembly of V-ATPase n=1 Tax=Hydnomerulius pinastri MD-312 TaxID=994086 RepID=A0A0C9VVA5_9AGAM|nr:hypothetical protein HYDPIDRAFT_189293 [Hydnomerulius pinastri MD-312]
MINSDKLNVSLEHHLLEKLTPLVGILPADLSDELAPCLALEKTAVATPVVPYDVIQKVSKWSRTPEGTEALLKCSPPLDPQSYTMVSLLAGTTTSPEKHFPPYIAKDPEEDRRRAANDRKAVSTVVNAVLSVAGTGVATWFAGGHTGMRIEWRALLAVCAALLVAFAEIILYMIWDSRRSKVSEPPRKRRVLVKHKKDIAEKGDPTEISPQASSTGIEDTSLRHRTLVTTDASDH